MKAIWQFILGVLRIIGQWIYQLFRWISHEEQQFVHFVGRLLRVERKIKSWPKRLLFPLRWLRYEVHYYRLLPSPFRVFKITVIFLLIFGYPYYQGWQRQQQQQAYYDQFYPYYLEHFRKAFPQVQAQDYARQYARRYAEYYTSEQYRDALRRSIELPVRPPTEAKAAQENNEMQPAESQPHVAQAVPPSPVAKPYAIAMSPRVYEVIRHFEGLSLKPYKDSGGAYTIGYGHLMQPHERFTRISEQRAEQLMRQDVDKARKVVDAHVKVPLNPFQRAALVSLVYNIGSYHFRTSTLLKQLNKGRYRQAANEFLRWNKVKGKVVAGLTRRRKAEQRLFLSQK